MDRRAQMATDPKVWDKVMRARASCTGGAAPLGAPVLATNRNKQRAGFGSDQVISVQ